MDAIPRAGADHQLGGEGGQAFEELVKTASCRNRRDPAAQTCPLLPKMPMATPGSPSPDRRRQTRWTPTCRPVRGDALRTRAFAQDGLAGGGRAGERDLVHARMRHQRRAGLRSETGDDIDRARRKAGFGDEFGQAQARHRRQFGGLQHHRAARRQRG
jgi:hypothetical protein